MPESFCNTKSYTDEPDAIDNLIRACANSGRGHRIAKVNTPSGVALSMEKFVSMSAGELCMLDANTRRIAKRINGKNTAYRCPTNS
jgi:hypothetical protein